MLDHFAYLHHVPWLTPVSIIIVIMSVLSTDIISSKSHILQRWPSPSLSAIIGTAGTEVAVASGVVGEIA